MCGMNAIVSLEERESQSKQFGSLVHRGPDQLFQMSHGQLSIDYFRLAVTGGKSGEAPVRSKNGRWTCFLNGEIYNFRTLSTLHLGEVLNSDTKVLVEGISKFGLKFFNFVHGMFAGILVDEFSSKVFVFRDFFGEKPLFYSFQANQVLISSEFQALSAKLEDKLELDFEAVADYFRFGYIEEPKTIDTRIKAFPKGSVVSIDCKNKTISTEFILEPLIPQNISLSYLINDVVNEVVASDVSQGYLLSGGFDSSTLIKLSKQRKNEGDQSFTLQGVGNSNQQDVSGARKFARKSGIKHHIIRISQSEVISRLPDLVYALDQPHADMSSFGYFKLFEAIKENNLKVAQVGHGVDEMFWGYKWFNDKIIASHGPSVERFFWSTPSDQTNLLDSLWMCSRKEVNGKLHPSDPYLLTSNKFQRARAEICHSYLSHNGLGQIDRLAMYHSVEPRAAFADLRLYFWAQQNSQGSSDFEKRAFKSAVSNPLQRRFSNRKKRGFDIGMMDFVNSVEFDNLYQRKIIYFKEYDIQLNPELKRMRLGARQKYRLLVLSLWLEAKL